MAALRGHASSVALSVEEDLDDIVHMVETVQPDVLHLCGDIERVPPDAVAHLRDRLPGVQIMQAVPVTGPESVEVALAFAPHCDLLLLDSDAPEIDGIGATGHTHDWNVSRAIVEAVELPVILAGGLSPDNVAEAIERVRPWGVDSLSHTNRRNADGGFSKDLELVERFVAAARAASAVPAAD
ncbi:phosphoribosylanthranilate isomerase [Planotetraspora sp. A-T 1434]|uniref:phosphoribosylanthranilate isomerase n=1 Tax=Planotetraspora sp. A-T 1434 TaxID=2979219 RepID=UPI0021C15BD2|nr:phosphoribosylanthranilate isomerase [Planotetraspora sp. A-T 1434]MCT9929876.1 phosphoribosylanthranilate isomerase [Planotetraspora sp. A-T 1434]